MIAAEICSRRTRATLFLLLFLAGCAGGGALPGLERLAEREQREGIRYRVVIEGENVPDDLANFLLAASEAARATDRLPASEVLLRRRARDDLPGLEAALRAKGYYDGKVSFELRRPRAPGSPPSLSPADLLAGPLDALVGTPVDVELVFRVEPGPRYRFATRQIRILGPAHGFEPPPPGRLGLKEGEPAEAEVVLAAERMLLERARRAGHARAQIGPRRLVVDHRTRTMDVELSIEPGPVYEFGEVRFRGAEGVDERFLHQVVAIAPGTRYDPALLDAARRRLLDTQLFSVVRIATGDPGDDYRLPVLIELTLRAQRSVGGALGYSTDEGPTARLFWEHRNIFGAAERLRTEASASLVVREAKAELRKPHVLSPAQDLIADTAVRFEQTEAFDSRSIRAGAALERRLAAGVTGSLGVAYRFVEIESSGETDLAALLSVPATLRVDASDSLLDPTRGWRLSSELTPVWDTRGQNDPFLRGRATHSRYFRIWNQPRTVLALRASAGSIVGVERDQIPADERFYAGGGGSVRGIPFRKAGPLDDGRDPLGGRSLLEGSVELRVRPWENWEVVGFFDVGSVFTSLVPDLSEEEPRYGTGIGVRYATPVGPIRFDVAVPVDPRKDVDDPFQFYISLGQAF